MLGAVRSHSLESLPNPIPQDAIPSNFSDSTWLSSRFTLPYEGSAANFQIWSNLSFRRNAVNKLTARGRLRSRDLLPHFGFWQKVEREDISCRSVVRSEGGSSSSRHLSMAVEAACSERAIKQDTISKLNTEHKSSHQNSDALVEFSVSCWVFFK